jgi:glutamine amidotransferase
MEPVVIVSTGVANTASVSASIRRLGFGAVISSDPELIHRAQRVVLPGVGSFKAGMSAIRERGLETAIRERVLQQQPLLAICLGLQLLCEQSEESPGITGIGVIDSKVMMLPVQMRVPQFGWNRVEAADSSHLVSGYAYYANSYCVTDPPSDWMVSTTIYGTKFAATFERGPVLACQFHPELSGAWGAALIKRWLVNVKASVIC